MLTNEIYTEFCEFWAEYRPAEKYANRRSCTFGEWLKRSPPARKAMLAAVKKNSINPERNPYFWVQDYPEPVPKDWNGSRILPDEPLVRALYKGRGGLYTHRDAEMYGMQILGEFRL